MTKQSHRVRYELANGGGVVLEELCALCQEPTSNSILCPVCGRLFCAEACYGVHLIARDELDPEEALAKIFTPEALGKKIEAPESPAKHWRRRPKP